MITLLKYQISRLQGDNFKSAYLAFLRVAISCWLLKEVFINWQSMDLLYGHAGFVESKPNVINRLPGGFAFIKNHYLWLIITYTMLLALNMAGIGRAFTAGLLFIMLYMVHQLNSSFVNGGDKMARMIVFYLAFADSYRYFVLFKKKAATGQRRKLQHLLSNLAAFSIMLQLCVAYFSSGWAKINHPLWWTGEAVYYALSMERFTGTPINQYLVQYRWLDWIINYAVLFFELLFPVFIWFRNLRKPLLLAGLIFHLCIYVFLMIYGFQIVFVLVYGLFLPNLKMVLLAEKMKIYFKRR